jgi:hypothetical protein
MVDGQKHEMAQIGRAGRLTSQLRKRAASPGFSDFLQAEASA